MAKGTPRFEVATYANLPPAAAYEHGVVIVTDRNNAWYYSDGVSWKCVGSILSTIPTLYRNYATRTEQPVNAVAGMLGGTAKIRHKNRVPFNKVKLVFPLYTVRTDGTKVTEIDISGNITIACAIEYPLTSGTYYQITFNSGATSITTTAAASNGYVVSDEITLPITIPADTSFATRTFIQCAATGAFYGGVYTSSSYSEGADYSATTPVDKTTSGTITTNFTFSYGPCAILTQGNLPCVAVFGSSSAYGTGDSASGDSNGNLGGTAQFLYRSAMGFIKLAAPGERSSFASATSTWKYRVGIMSLCNPQIAIFHSISNDIITSGGITDLASCISIQQNCINIVRNVIPSIKTMGFTFQPRTTSSDSWATDANQTAVGGMTPIGASLRETWNDYLAAGNTIYDATSTGVTDVTESPTKRGAWINSTGGAGPGTANYATTDGVHKTAALHSLVGLRHSVSQLWNLLS